jgi:hypothetical protein
MINPPFNKPELINNYVWRIVPFNPEERKIDYLCTWRVIYNSEDDYYCLTEHVGSGFYVTSELPGSFGSAKDVWDYLEYLGCEQKDFMSEKVIFFDLEGIITKE